MWVSGVFALISVVVLFFWFFFVLCTGASNKAAAGDWEKFRDDAEAAYYWYNHSTGESTWQDPYRGEAVLMNADNFVVSTDCVLNPAEFEMRWLAAPEVASTRTRLTAFPTEFVLTEYLATTYFWLIAYGNQAPQVQALSSTLLSLSLRFSYNLFFHLIIIHLPPHWQLAFSFHQVQALSSPPSLLS